MFRLVLLMLQFGSFTSVHNIGLHIGLIEMKKDKKEHHLPA